MQESPSNPDQKSAVKQFTLNDEKNECEKTDTLPLEEVREIGCGFKTPEKTNCPNQTVGNEVNENDTTRKPSTPESGTNKKMETTSTPLKMKKVEAEFKTPEKTIYPNQTVENEVNENDTPKKPSTPESETNKKMETTSTPLKMKKVEAEFKTPEKTIYPNQTVENEVNENDTPKKPNTPQGEINLNAKTNSTPLKEFVNSGSAFKTPEKSSQTSRSVDNTTNGTPGRINNFGLKLEQSCDGEDGMISTTEQARLLIAASKTPSKSMNRTPVKQNTPSARRSIENSPVTPGKHRRVELITLASPKAKRMKQM